MRMADNRLLQLKMDDIETTKIIAIWESCRSAMKPSKDLIQFLNDFLDNCKVKPEISNLDLYIWENLPPSTIEKLLELNVYPNEIAVQHMLDSLPTALVIPDEQAIQRIKLLLKTNLSSDSLPSLQTYFSRKPKIWEKIFFNPGIVLSFFDANIFPHNNHKFEKLIKCCLDDEFKTPAERDQYKLILARLNKVKETHQKIGFSDNNPFQALLMRENVNPYLPIIYLFYFLEKYNYQGPANNLPIEVWKLLLKDYLFPKFIDLEQINTPECKLTYLKWYAHVALEEYISHIGLFQLNRHKARACSLKEAIKANPQQVVIKQYKMMKNPGLKLFSKYGNHEQPFSKPSTDEEFIKVISSAKRIALVL